MNFFKKWFLIQGVIGCFLGILANAFIIFWASNLPLTGYIYFTSGAFIQFLALFGYIFFSKNRLFATSLIWMGIVGLTVQYLLFSPSLVSSGLFFFGFLLCFIAAIIALNPEQRWLVNGLITSILALIVFVGRGYINQTSILLIYREPIFYQLIAFAQLAAIFGYVISPKWRSGLLFVFTGAIGLAILLMSDVRSSDFYFLPVSLSLAISSITSAIMLA